MNIKHDSIGLNILEDISTIILHSHDLQETLDNIVTIVAKRLKTDVCSIYLLEPDGETLLLKATKGLSKTAINRTAMKISEGLTGLAIETNGMVMTDNAPTHPRYKYFKQTREEKFLSFLGLPIFERQKPIGVIIIQTREARVFSNESISALRTISVQISGIILNARLLDSIQHKEQERAWFEQELTRTQAFSQTDTPASSISSGRPRMLSGIAVSAGYMRGKAYILDRFSKKVIQAAKVGSKQEELQKFSIALEKVKIETVYMEKRISETLSKEDSAIFHTHLMILEDRSFCKKISDLIEHGAGATKAVHDVVDHYVQVFSSMEDVYLRERSADMEDIGRRIIDALEGNESTTLQLKKKRIIVAEDIFPSDLAMMDHDKILAIITEKGNVYSHAAIMAKALGIPSVLGIKNLIEAVNVKDDIIVDGTTGNIFINPGDDIIKEYARHEKEHAVRLKELESLRDLPAVTTDGFKIILSANIGLISDIKLANSNGAEGVGLYRTEFPYMTRTSFPTRAEQSATYSRILEAFPGQPVNIRTLDIGGDKGLPYFKGAHEENPFMGLRSIRLSLEHQDIFRDQLAAILLASPAGQPTIMFPLISSVDEILQIKEIFSRLKDELQEQGHNFVQQIPLGIMVEIPAAVQIIDMLIDEVDYVSIGTNDLIQYTLAADRNNPNMKQYYDPLHPAVLQSIKRVADAAARTGKKASVCGEMASDPVIALLFAGMGITEFSLSASSIPVVKHAIRNQCMADCRDFANMALTCRSGSEVSRVLEMKRAELKPF
jgi:phosphotransferase system, enzyme I, PtsP